uniref:AlNc14C173G8059 protein n=1 Tax=Albugo laibachii Nc14 TaxID=890382 RepID=F0WNN8_9STRA|nr:AlNc14C173G8059 [Albugo laibachii Nc14]|eukprot:CCA22929.1 AlNc14C173G8059 [Albugo laibachii Nc14]
MPKAITNIKYMRGEAERAYYKMYNVETTRVKETGTQCGSTPVSFVESEVDEDEQQNSALRSQNTASTRIGYGR